MILLLFLGNTNKVGDNHIITRGQGVLLLLCTLAYIIFTIYEENAIKNKKIDEEIIKDVESKEEKSIFKIFIFLIVGILGLKFGSDFVVDNSISIATRLGLSEKFIGMTVVAIGTALPEIITGIIAGRKNETDLLIGNLIGSNILNLCLLIGLGAVINPLTFISDFNRSIIVLIIITYFLQWVTRKNEKNELNRKVGAFLIIFYIVYVICMI